MRKAELFDGFKIIEVGEGEKFRLERQIVGHPGLELSFKVRDDITVKAKVVSKDATGTTCVVTNIIAKDSIAEQVLDSIDVDFEENTDKVNTITFNQKDSKKNIIAQIEELGLNINTNQTKAKILEELKELSNVEII